MIYTLPITLDIYSSNQTYRVKQNDAGSRYLLATINANGVLQTVPATATVSLKVVKPDDTKTLTAGTVSNGKILVELTNQTLAVAGMAYCELQIIESNPTTLLKTIRFQLLIDAEVYSDTVAESTDEFTALTVALADINEVKNDIATLEDNQGTMADLTTTAETLVGAINELDSEKEDKSNKVTSIDSESTDTQYPSAKLTYDQLATKEPNLPATPLLPTEKFLNGNKEWAVPAHNKLTDLNTDADYQHMSSAEKTKLNTIAQGSVRVGLTNNVAGDLVAKTDKQILIGDGTDLKSVAVSGDVTISNTGVTSIGNNKVTNAKLAQMNTKTIKGNDTAGTANAKDLTVAETKALLDIDDLETAVTELQADVNIIEETPQEIYGLHWDKVNNAFTRTNSARGAIVNLGVDNEVKYNEMDFSSLFSDWEEVTDSYGNVFARVPKIYLAKTDDAAWRVNVASKKPIKKGYLPYCFWDFVNNKELPYVDISKHIGSLSDDGTRLESKPGKYPLINKNIVQMRTLAQANGAGYQQLDIHTVDLLQTLFVIEQATLDSQSKAMGYVNGRYTATDLAVITESDTYRVVLSNAAAAPYEVGQSISIGTTQGGNQIFYGRTILSITEYDVDNKVLTFSGDPVTITAGNMVYNTSYKTGFSSGIASSVGSLVSNSSGKHPFAWHGIESLYGDIWQFVDGLNINDNQSWVCRDADDYASNLFAAPYEKLSYINATSNNYVLTRGFDRAHPYAQLPTAVGAIGDSQYKDYYYQATGQRIARVGGGWGYGSNAGLFCWLLGDSSADTDLSVGGRLLKKAL